MPTPKYPVSTKPPYPEILILLLYHYLFSICFSCTCATTMQWPSTSSCPVKWTIISLPKENFSRVEEITPRFTSVPVQWQILLKLIKRLWGEQKVLKAFSAVQGLFWIGMIYVTTRRLFLYVPYNKTDTLSHSMLKTIQQYWLTHFK